MDLILRNARLPHAPDTLVDIGVKSGKIVAIRPNLVADAPQTHDAGGCLVCAGFCETHIHLEKSRIIDRCAPEQGRNPMAMQRVSAVKHSFTPEDILARAQKTLERQERTRSTHALDGHRLPPSPRDAPPPSSNEPDDPAPIPQN
jgi:cytosine deaminase